MDLQGRHVLITGGSRGIGAALARSFADAGAQVSVAARSTADIERVADEVGGAAFTVDLLDTDQVDGLLPTSSPEHLAERTVRAVQADRRHVRTPKRLSTQFWLAELPRRVNELILAKVPLGPTSERT